MLASVMPGVRELRAPLAAGYLWLLAIWLALEPSFSRADLEHGLYASLLKLNDAITALGTGVALSVLAYIVGSISEQTLGPVMRTRRPVRWLAARRAHSVTAGRTASRSLGRLAGRVSAPLGRLLRRLGVIKSESDPRLDRVRLAAQGFDEPELGLGSKGAAALEALSAPIIPRIERELRSRRQRRDARLSDVLERVRRASAAPDVPLAAAIEAALGRAILDEARLIRLKMLYDERDLYSEIDRFSAESEFRFAILPAAMALTAVLGLRSAAWWVLVLLAVALVLIYAQAVIRRISAGDILLEAVQLKPDRSPFLEHLLAMLPDTRPTPRGSTRRHTIEKVPRRS